jgi:hypothetical protein
LKSQLQTTQQQCPVQVALEGLWPLKLFISQAEWDYSEIDKDVMESASDQHDVGGKKESVFEYIHEQLAPLKLRSRPP